MKQLLLLPILCSFYACLTGELQSTTIDTGPNHIQVETSHVYPQDLAATDQDRLTNNNIRDVLKGFSQEDFDNISLTTVNGKVRVDGSVKTEQAKTFLTGKINSIYPTAIINIKVDSLRFTQ